MDAESFVHRFVTGALRPVEHPLVNLQPFKARFLLSSLLEFLVDFAFSLL